MASRKIRDKLKSLKLNLQLKQAKTKENHKYKLKDFKKQLHEDKTSFGITD